MEVHKYVTAPAQVQVSYGLTMNLGNYESARIDVLVLVPCYREEIEDAYTWARDMATTKVAAERAEVRNAGKTGL